MESGGGDIQLFLSPGATGRLRLRNAGRVAARPGTVRMAAPQGDGSLLLHLPLGLGPAAGSQPVTGLGLRPAADSAAAGFVAAGAPQQPLSRLQRAAGAQQQQQQQQQHERPPPGNAVTSASREGSGADIVLDAGGIGWVLCMLQCYAASRPASAYIAACSFRVPACPHACCSERCRQRVRKSNCAGGTGTISITERGWMDALRQKHGVQ